MSNEPISGQPYQEAGSKQTDAVQNAMLNYFATWSTPVVLAVGQAAPTGSEVDGDRYIVGTGTGAFTGHDGKMAVLRGTWTFFAPPAAGVPIVKSLDDGNDYECDDTGTWAIKSGGAGGSAAVAVQFVADTGSTADSAPGVGLMKWNNATQASATVLYFDDLSEDAVSMTGLWAAMDANGFLFLQHATNQDTWQIWDVSAINDSSGYAKFTAAILADGGAFADGDPMLVHFEQGASAVTFTGGALTSALNEAKATDIASASTTNIGAATGNLVHITGTTTINALGTVQAGTERELVFDGILTLTHNGTSLILPTGANITTAAGDCATMRSEGGGNWKCVKYQRANGQALASTGSSLANFTEASTIATPNATTPYKSFTALDAGYGNLDVAIVPKGTGAFSFGVANNATSGGNKRGARAIDLQIYRGSNGQVASGPDSFAFGHSNRSSGTSSMAVGLANNVGNDYAFAFGQSNLSDGFGSSAFGYGSNTRGVSYLNAWAGYQFGNSDGSVQDVKLMLVKSTTNATLSYPASDSGALTFTNTLAMPNNSSMVFEAIVVARQNTTGDTKSWLVQGHIRRGANAAATAMVAAATITPLAADAGAAAWTLGVIASTTLGCPLFEVTGEASKTIRWAVLVKNALQLAG